MPKLTDWSSSQSAVRSLRYQAMTKLAVSIMVDSLDQALGAASRAAEHGADLVEFRIDRFTDQPPLVTQLVEQSDLPCIITCRPTWEGGDYDGDEQTRISLLEHAALGTRQPAYIDIELAAYQSSANLRQKIGLIVDHPGQIRSTSTGLILSSHDFESRPVDLYQRIEAMAAAPACRVMKVVWRARSLRDNTEAFEVIASRHKPTIALCMGEAGLPSRVLAKKFGALLTFAALEPTSTTAAGQPTIDQLKQLYRWDALTAQTRVYSVIGYPIAHSMSPAIHNAGFDHVGYDGVYLPMPIPSEYEHFKATLSTWLDTHLLDFHGASVTIPHKQNLLRYVQEQGGNVEPLTEQIGAANTLSLGDNNQLYASNTDYAAALDAVCDRLNIERSDLAGQRIAVIGAGGVARAVVAGFASCGATVVVYNRSLDNAQRLADQFTGRSGKVVAAPLEKLCDSCCQIYINCTPLGMAPHNDKSPISDTGSLKSWGPGTVVFDTIYNPPTTRLLRDAHQAGCVTIGGAEMFIRQAAGQFKLWTGLEAPIHIFRKVLDDQLAT